jgi:DNA-directed RNA polymerase subunit M/transcription elongation factor TFIIS
MTTTILIVCPECGKQIKAPENVVGKKVRCKSCQAAFVAASPVSGGNKGKPPNKSVKPATIKKPTDKPAKASKYDEEDDDPNPYGLIDVDLSPRCPDCANEVEEGAVICLTCGYNMRTREKAKTRRVYDLTAGEHFLWLLPGIACALAVCCIIGFNIWYLLKIDEVVSWENDNFFLGMWTINGIKLWVVIMSLFLIWLAGKFAVKRLILHPKPPEVVKTK